MVYNLEGVLAITLSLLIPVVAIISGIVYSIKSNNNEKEIRRMLIENHTDPETAKLMLKENEKKGNKNKSLRWACILIGVGVGAFADYLMGMDPENNIYFWMVIFFGIGLGLLASFIVEMKMERKKAGEERE